MLQHFSHVHKNAMLKNRMWLNWLSISKLHGYKYSKVKLFVPIVSSNSQNDQIIVNNLRSSFRVKSFETTRNVSKVGRDTFGLKNVS
jgi:hypothetical protein